MEERSAMLADADKKSQLLEALGQVLDPELDRSMLEMGFVTTTEVQDDTVTVNYSLPTFWCSINFAYIMSEDLREAALALPWVKEALIVLEDHHCAEEINAAIAGRKEFEQAFPGQPSGSLQRLRKEFRLKSYYSRQSKLLNLLKADLTPEAIVKMDIQSVNELASRGEPELADAACRYLEARDSNDMDLQPEAIAFTDHHGAGIDAEGLAKHMRETRRYTMAINANAEMCGLYLQERRKGVKASQPAAIHIYRQ